MCHGHPTATFAPSLQDPLPADISVAAPPLTVCVEAHDSFGNPLPPAVRALFSMLIEYH